MSDIAIRVEGLSKRFSLGKQERYRTLRDTLTDVVKGPFRRLMSEQSQEPSDDETLWALKDVSFEVKHGEVLGVIGRNGAGKSTLLKILSRITEPTHGRVEIHGRVGSLLEVGTGFHPELSGRENIFLNGAILGMKKVEIARKFDEIVAFAEVEKFVDTPVKHYSSGMYVRLAFAVAAHMESEILVIDEVLAVGDAEFQKKCLGKMDEIAHRGRTVLFVSHQMSTVQSLCSRAILLSAGRVAENNVTYKVIDSYLSSIRRPQLSLISRNAPSFNSLHVAIPDGAVELTPWTRVTFRGVLTTPTYMRRCYVNLTIDDPHGRSCIHLRTDFKEIFPDFAPGSHEISVSLNSLNLLGGTYYAWFRLVSEASDVLLDSDHLILEVKSDEAKHEATGAVIAVNYEWKLTTVKESDAAARTR